MKLLLLFICMPVFIIAIMVSMLGTFIWFAIKRKDLFFITDWVCESIDKIID